MMHYSSIPSQGRGNNSYQLSHYTQNLIYMISKEHIIKRFISYVTIDTESDPNSETTPSTKKQWDLANKLADELKAIGMQDVSINDNA